MNSPDRGPCRLCPDGASLINPSAMLVVVMDVRRVLMVVRDGGVAVRVGVLPSAAPS